MGSGGSGNSGISGDDSGDGSGSSEAPESYGVSGDFSIFIPLSFPVDSSNGDRVCAHIAIIDDKAFDKTEILEVQLTSEDNVVIHVPMATIHVLDNEGMTLKNIQWNPHKGQPSK